MSSRHRNLGPTPLRPQKRSDVGAAKNEDYVAGVPLARVIPRELDPRVELVMLTQPHSLAAERFRRLASTLEAHSKDEGLVVVVTSAVPSEGKTTVSMNLALAFASDADDETLIIDGDLRRPAMHRWLKTPPGLGLFDVLGKKIGLEHAIHSIKNAKLRLLPAGSSCDDPVETLKSGEARQLISELRRRYRRIVIDTPPILPFADADVLGRLGTGVLLVARSRKTPRKAYQRALTLLESARVLGVVLNDYTASFADGKVQDARYYSEYYYRNRKER